MCEKEISIPQECKIQNFKIYVHAPFNSNLTLNSFKNMTDEELKKVIKDTQQSISEGFFSGSLYFDVKLEIDGDQIQSEHLLNEIVMYFKNITLAIEGNYLINGKSYKISDDK